MQARWREESAKQRFRTDYCVCVRFDAQTIDGGLAVGDRRYGVGTLMVWV